jgi:mannose-1-phosphate guanylyltransferase / phosphomannomutase
MKAIILAAGKGTRLKPLTNNIPKVMLPINGKPLLEYTIKLFKKYGIKEIAINLHHLPEKIKDYFGDGKKFGVKIYYSYEPKLLGTAGAIKKIEDFFDDTFIVFYGDNFTNLNILDMVNYHESKKGIATICLHKGKSKSSYIEMDSNNKIVKFVEKPKIEKYGWVNSGIYVLEKEVIKFIPKNKFFDFGKDLFPLLLKKNKKIFGYPLKDCFWFEVGTLEKYEKINLLLSKDKELLSQIDFN